MPHFQTDPFDDSLLRLILEVCMGVCKIYPVLFFLPEKAVINIHAQQQGVGVMAWGRLTCTIQTVGCVGVPPFLSGDLM